MGAAAEEFHNKGIYYVPRASSFHISKRYLEFSPTRHPKQLFILLNLFPNYAKSQ